MPAIALIQIKSSGDQPGSPVSVTPTSPIANSFLEAAVCYEGAGAGPHVAITDASGIERLALYQWRDERLERRRGRNFSLLQREGRELLDHGHEHHGNGHGVAQHRRVLACPEFG